jgi:CDP-diacylglycerol--glycerol-3-phosphate 3-phosphatidyltransferase
MRLPDLLPKRLSSRYADPMGRAVARTGITPNMVSLLGFVGVCASGVLVARGDLLIAGIVFLVCSALDMVDGAVARATGKASPYGAVFDAVLDRMGEAALLAGAAYYFGERGEHWHTAAVFAALVGSISVSYIRARAEVVGLELREGLFRRQERVVLITLALLTGFLAVGIWILAVLSQVTALQRFYAVTRVLWGASEADGGPASA